MSSPYRSSGSTGPQREADLPTESAFADPVEQRSGVLDGRPSRVPLDLVPVDPGGSGLRRIVAAAVVVVVVVVAMVGINLLPSSGDGVGLPTPGPASPSSGVVAEVPLASPSTTSSPSRLPGPMAAPIAAPAAPEDACGAPHGRIVPGAYSILWPPTDFGRPEPLFGRPPLAVQGRIHFTIPGGWWWMDAGTTIYKYFPYCRGSPDLYLQVHDVARVPSDFCSRVPLSAFEPVGPTVDDLTTALLRAAGPDASPPSDVVLSGYPAKKLDLNVDRCVGGPEGRLIWQNANGTTFGALKGGASTAYIVDVNGDRLVIGILERGASAQDLAELDGIVSSINIRSPQCCASAAPDAFVPGAHPMNADLPVGRVSAKVEDVAFSFNVAANGWEPQLGFYVSKSFAGPQGAEAIILWTTFPDALDTDPCPHLLGPSLGPALDDLAAAVATVPGTDATGPLDVTVGGQAAKYVVLTVRDDVGCDPGFFFSWSPLMGGAMWYASEPGDTLRVWIVDMDGTLLFIEAASHRSYGPPDDQEVGPAVEGEILEIIDSIEFE